MRKAYMKMMDDSSSGSEEHETAIQREIKEKEEIIMLPFYRMWFIRTLLPIAIGAGVIAGLVIAGSILGLTLDFNNDDIRNSETFGTENDRDETNPSQSLSPSKTSSQPSPPPSETPWDNPPSPRRKPNILIIMADDFGTGDMPAYWNSSIVDMPNLNRLGAKGVTFKDVHSTPLCAPSRYMLLSGLYAHRGQNQGGSWSLRQNSNQFRGKQQSIARVLKERANYHTFMTGKWHIGAKAPPNGLYNFSHSLTHPMHDWSQALIDGPTDIGFDSSFITIGGIQAPPYSFFRDGFLTTEQENVMYWGTDSEHDMPHGRSIIGKHGGEGSKDWDSTAYNMILVNETIAFVDNHLDDKPDDPFFAYVALGGVHIPHSPPDFYMDGTVIKGQYMTSHLDILHEVDLVVGSLVGALEERLLMKDTIIIFTSDNGGLHKSQQFSHYSNGILRGNKGQIWEGGHRVPMIWRYDGVFPENESREHLIGLNDLFATLCEIVGVDIPYGTAYDSVSFAPYIAMKEKTEMLREYLGTWSYDSGVKGFKHALRQNGLKLVHSPRTHEINLFDLMDDISETMDLSGTLQHLDTMKSMYKELIALGPCPDDVSGFFLLSKTLAKVGCSWFMKNTNSRCKDHIEGELLCNSICGRYKDACNDSLFANGKMPDVLQ